MTSTPSAYWTDPLAADFRALAAQASTTVYALHHEYERLEMRAARLLVAEVARGRVPKAFPELSMQSELHNAIEAFERERGHPVVTLSELLHPNNLMIGQPVQAASPWSPPAVAVYFWRYTVKQIEQEHSAMFAGRSLDPVQHVNCDLPDTINEGFIREAAGAASIACALLAHAAMWTAPSRNEESEGVLPDDDPLIKRMLECLYRATQPQYYMKAASQMVAALDDRNVNASESSVSRRMRLLIESPYAKRPPKYPHQGIMLTDDGRQYYESIVRQVVTEK